MEPEKIKADHTLLGLAGRPTPTLLYISTLAAECVLREGVGQRGRGRGRREREGGGERNIDREGGTGGRERTESGREMTVRDRGAEREREVGGDRGRKRVTGKIWRKRKLYAVRAQRQALYFAVCFRRHPWNSGSMLDC